MGTVGDYASELDDFYSKVQALEKAVPREFGYKLSSVLSAYYEMFSRFCPFRVGDRVRLAKTPAIEKGSGWYGSRHFLVEGAIATVVCCDWRKGQFVFDLEFDGESWLDEKGQVHSVPFDRRHSFGFGESWLAPDETDIQAKVSLVCVLGQFASHVVCLSSKGIPTPYPEELESAITALRQNLKHRFVDGWEHLPLLNCTQSDLNQLLKAAFKSIPVTEFWQIDLDSLAWNVAQSVFELTAED